jgi:alpha-tubulin suppressor-like RCC1 family protein
MAVAATTPATLYASVGDITSPVVLYRGTDGSASAWTPESAPDYTGNAYAYGLCNGSPCAGEQGNYDNVVAVDPNNSSHVLAGGETVVETTNATASTPTWTNVNGTPFNNSNNNPLHPDQHAIAFAPDGSVWIGNDGGIYQYQGGSVTNDNSGLNVVQFMYGMSENVDRGVLGGTQDNATTLGFPTSRWFGLPGHEIAQSTWGWTAINGGDGGPSAYWEGYPPGSNVFAWWGVFENDRNLLVNGPNFPLTGNPVQITPPETFDTTTPFTPPLATAPNAADPTNPTLFYGLKNLWRTTNPTASPPTWTKVTTLGKGVSAIAVAPSNPKVVYVGFQDGTVQVSTNGGAVGTFTSLAGQPFGDTWITGLSVNPKNAKQIVASVSYNYVRSVFLDPKANGSPTPLPHVAQYAYTTNASTGAWTKITGNLPGNIGVSHVIFDNGALVAATDAKVYATGAPNGDSTVWKPVGSGLPDVQVQDLYLDPLTSVLFAATHGRGVWEIHAPIFGAAVAGDNSGAELGGSGAPVGGGNISRVPVLACCPGGPQSNVNTVAAGGQHELALLLDGTMMSWGSNNEGQLGNGVVSGFADAPVKVSLPAGKTATAIAAGESHSLALLNDGSVVAWGRNFEGQLGNGANSDSNVPVPVQLPAGKTAIAIAAGGNFSLALLNDGSIVSWGSNSLGQLGNGLNGDSNVPVPVSLPAGKSASVIGAGFYHGLAVLTDGTAVAWGDNASGQLGDGVIGGAGCGGSCSRVPVAISVPAGVSFVGLDGGIAHSLAKAANGAAYAWGDNTYGELGIDATGGPDMCGGNPSCHATPVKVKLPKTATVTAVSAGGNFSMALLDGGTAEAWGTNDYGELGNGSPSPSPKPIAITSSVGSPVAISAGDFDSLMAVAVGDIS